MVQSFQADMQVKLSSEQCISPCFALHSSFMENGEILVEMMLFSVGCAHRCDAICAENERTEGDDA